MDISYIRYRGRGENDYSRRLRHVAMLKRRHIICRSSKLRKRIEENSMEITLCLVLYNRKVVTRCVRSAVCKTADILHYHSFHVSDSNFFRGKR